ncbi:hypothetical protein [Klugiella xanthotipulae]|uniref:hypothetical protein n=1 Tax=Klugiella xanthotipulae TaxID=244735 RepID=UPI001476E98E|nr:hypothetical protein [Klugiella xanthotipulae]
MGAAIQIDIPQTDLVVALVSVESSWASLKVISDDPRQEKNLKLAEGQNDIAFGYLIEVCSIYESTTGSNAPGGNPDWVSVHATLSPDGLICSEG